MSTDTPISGIPSGGFSTTQSYTSDGFDDQSDIDGLIARMEALLKHPLYGTGMALLFAMNILMPACMNFQEGILQQEVDQQNLLDDMSNKMAKIQSLFNSCDGESKENDDVAGKILDEWKGILKDANNSVFGRGSDHETKLYQQLYNESGEGFQPYEKFSVDKHGHVEPKTDPKDSKLGEAIYKAWHKAGEIDKSGGDNGVAVKGFQDLFSNVTSAVTGQQGSVQAAEKYRQQVHSSVQSAMKNIGQYLNNVQKNEVDATKSASN